MRKGRRKKNQGNGLIFLVVIIVGVSFSILSYKNYKKENIVAKTQVVSNKIYPNIDINFNEWQDNVEVFQVNKENPRSFFIPYINLNSLFTKVKSDIYDSFKINNSENLILLNGNWKFSLDNKPSERNMEFFKNDFDVSKWDNIKVPSSWQYEGYDHPIYVNLKYPWGGFENVEFYKAPETYNPIGNYKRTFNIDESFIGNRIYISFQGVESCFYLWINGEIVGYSEDSFSPSEFDITDFVSIGENTVSVQVFRWCDGSFIEDQDFIRLSGIFRDVFIYKTPQIHIRDFEIITDLDKNYIDSELIVNFNILNHLNTNKKYTLDISLFDDNWNLVSRKSDLGDFSYSYTYKDYIMQTNHTISFDINNPKKWSAEEPNLYNLVIALKNEFNKEIECIHSRVGFRKFELIENKMYLNGEKLLFKGVNRHETHPHKGRAIDLNDMVFDIKEIKRNNINAVRTSHYPNHSYFIKLCNEFGVYIMDEANIEAHAVEGEIPGDKFQWRGACFDRVSSLVERDKNDPSVLIWSLGNESGGGSVFKELYDYIKNRDKTRLVHYEGEKCFYNSTDMVSKMYVSYKDIEKEHEYIKEKPYVLCEYAHSMGNSGGSLNKYMEEFEKFDNVQGGFIWDFIDQSIYKNVPDIGIFRNDSKIFNGEFEGYIESGYFKNGYKGIINYPEFRHVNFKNGFTIDLKVKPSVYEGRGCVYLKKGNEFGLQEVMNYRNSNERAVEFYINSLNKQDSIAFIVDDNWYKDWHKISASFDTKYIKLYIDDVLVGEKYFGEDIAYYGSHIQIGGNNNIRHNEAMNAVIDDVRLFSKGFDNRSLKIITPYHKNSGNILWLDFDNNDVLYSKKGVGKYLAFGGDFNDYPNDNSFCANGILLSNRKQKPEMQEVKHVYQNIEFIDKDILNGEIIIKNKNLFINLNQYMLKWDYLIDGRFVEGDSISLDIPSKSEYVFNIPDIHKALNLNGKDYFINFKILLNEDIAWANKGFVIASDQIEIPFENLIKEVNSNFKNVQKFDLWEENQIIKLKSNEFDIEFDISNGALKKYLYRDDVLIKNPIMVNFWNPLNDNERLQQIYNDVKFWKDLSKLKKIDSYEILSDEKENIVINFFRVIHELNSSIIRSTYKINKFGDIFIEFKLDLNIQNIFHARSQGFKLKIPNSYQNIEFYGKGPIENYEDRNTGSKIGIFNTNVNSQYTDYITPQRTGNLTDVRWIKFYKNEESNCIVISSIGNNPKFIQVNTTNYDDNEFEKNHKYLMNKNGSIIVNLRSKDHGSTFESFNKKNMEYIGDNVTYEFSFVLSSSAFNENPNDVYNRVIQSF